MAVYLFQVSNYEDYVSSLKFNIYLMNQRTGDKRLVYDHGYGKKYRHHDPCAKCGKRICCSWGAGEILFSKDYIKDDVLTIICEMTIPGHDKTT